MIKASQSSYTIIRATQFFEFVKQVVDYSTQGSEVRMPPALIQPMAGDDAASAVAEIATREPLNGTIEIGGPDQFRLDELARRYLAARPDPAENPRKVVTDPQGRYYSIEVGQRALVPDQNAQLSKTRFKIWVTQPAPASVQPVAS